MGYPLIGRAWCVEMGWGGGQCADSCYLPNRNDMRFCYPHRNTPITVTNVVLFFEVCKWGGIF